MKKVKKILGFGLLLVIGLAILIPQFNMGQTGKVKAAGVYEERFRTLFMDIQTKGYLSSEGVPYHSLETLMVETPVDYGHETTSDELSYLTWLGATYGKITGDWSYYMRAWDVAERYIIPTAADQPGIENYDPNHPAPYVPQADLPSNYPVTGNANFPTGIDPIGNDLKTAYGAPIYQMHRLLDVDNFNRYGNHGDGTSRCSYIDSWARGAQESVWECIPHPCWDIFNWGATNGGFLPLYITNPAPTRQWQYATMGGADARQIQASYWAYIWAAEQGKAGDIAAYTTKAAKLGDFLRYVMFDKYFKPIGIQNGTTVGAGYDSCHYLLGAGLTWGGEISGTHSWRTGSSDNQQGYQNPVAAYALANIPSMNPKTPNAKTDLATSMARQIELYQYLQSAEGPIAGGVTNSWGGRYLTYPAGASTFYKMAYDPDPVSHDPPSNMWFGYQTWSMERLAEYYYLIGDNKAKWVLDKWVNWALNQISLNSDGTYSIPAALSWSGQPDPWTGTYSANPNLRCVVKDYNNDVGVAASLAKVLIYYAAGSSKWAGNAHQEAKIAAKELVDRLWLLYDSYGIAVPETRSDYIRFYDEVYVPVSYTGITAQGVTLRNGMTFIDLHPGYNSDPSFAKVQAYRNGGSAPVFTYHRFWAQAEIAMANALFQVYFMVDTPTPTTTPSPTAQVTVTATPTPTVRMTATPTKRATLTPTFRRRATSTPTRRFRVTPTPTRAATPTMMGFYAVSFVVQSDWGSGATINVTIINNTLVAVNGWTLTWTWPDEYVITNMWNATYSQIGITVSVRDGGYNAYIGPNGGSVNFGLNVTYIGTLTKPTDFKLNGVSCQVQ